MEGIKPEAASQPTKAERSTGRRRTVGLRCLGTGRILRAHQPLPPRQAALGGRSQRMLSGRFFKTRNELDSDPLNNKQTTGEICLLLNSTTSFCQSTNNCQNCRSAGNEISNVSCPESHHSDGCQFVLSERGTPPTPTLLLFVEMKQMTVGCGKREVIHDPPYASPPAQ